MKTSGTLQEMIDRLKHATADVDVASHCSSLEELRVKVYEFCDAIEALHYHLTWYYEI